jgi:hypothetical protein
MNALKGSAAGYLTGTLGAPADFLSMIPLSPREGGNPYAGAVKDFLGDPEKPFLGSDYLADKIGLGGEGLAYGAGQMISPAGIKDLLKGGMRSDIFVRPKKYWEDWAETERLLGKSPEEIYQGGGEHGPGRMFKGADEQWYQEIPDYNAKLTPKALEILDEKRNMFDPDERNLVASMVHQKMDELYPGKWATKEDMLNDFYEDGAMVRRSETNQAGHELYDAFDKYAEISQKIRNERGQITGTVRDVLHHPELEEVAPELFDLPIEFNRYGIEGSFNPSTKTIKAGTPAITRDNPEIEILLHEIQHGAQQLYDYGGGGSPMNVFMKDKFFVSPPSEGMVQDYAEQLKSAVEPYRPVQRFAFDPKNPAPNERQDAYRRIHGEQIASMAGDRYTTPPNELKAPEYNVDGNYVHPSNLIYALPPSLQKLLESLKGVP